MQNDWMVRIIRDTLNKRKAMLKGDLEAICRNTKMFESMPIQKFKQEFKASLKMLRYWGEASLLDYSTNIIVMSATMERRLLDLLEAEGVMTQEGDQ